MLRGQGASKDGMPRTWESKNMIMFDEFYPRSPRWGAPMPQPACHEYQKQENGDEISTHLFGNCRSSCNAYGLHISKHDE